MITPAFVFTIFMLTLGPIKTVPAWCTDQEYVRNDPCPRFGSDGADIARASQLQHTVEDMNSRVDFGRPTFVST